MESLGLRIPWMWKLHLILPCDRLVMEHLEIWHQSLNSGILLLYCICHGSAWEVRLRESSSARTLDMWPKRLPHWVLASDAKAWKTHWCKHAALLGMNILRPNLQNKNTRQSYRSTKPLVPVPRSVVPNELCRALPSESSSLWRDLGILVRCALLACLPPRKGPSTQYRVSTLSHIHMYIYMYIHNDSHYRGTRYLYSCTLDPYKGMVRFQGSGILGHLHPQVPHLAEQYKAGISLPGDMLFSEIPEGPDI